MTSLTRPTPATRPHLLAGPCVPGFDGGVARVIELPTGGWRIEHWIKGRGWIEAPEGAFTLDEFMPGACRPPSINDAARLGCRLEDFGRHWTEEPATPRHRANIVHMLKARAWHLAARQVRPGRA